MKLRQYVLMELAVLLLLAIADEVKEGTARSKGPRGALARALRLDLERVVLVRARIVVPAAAAVVAEATPLVQRVVHAVVQQKCRLDRVGDEIAV